MKKAKANPNQKPATPAMTNTEIRNILEPIIDRMTRKAWNWKQINTVKLDWYSDRIRHTIAALPQVHVTSMTLAAPCSDLPDGHPFIFVLRNSESGFDYIVDTEGFDYARYIVRIEL